MVSIIINSVIELTRPLISIDAVYGSQQGIRPEMASLGAILIALGLFLCVMGFRLFKPMLIIMGLLTFGSMTWIALANNKPSTHYANDSITMITVPAGLGVLGAILYFQFWYIAIYLVGSLGGLALAAFICTWKSNLVIEHVILSRGGGGGGGDQFINSEANFFF